MLSSRFNPANTFRRAAVVVAAVLLVLLGQQPAHAAPARADSQSRPVYLIHGYAFGSSGIDCASYWSATRSWLPAWGWTGEVWTVGYYQGDTYCAKRVIEGTHNTSIVEVARQLAWRIYNDNSRYNVSVDIIAHSMGGLIARAAIAGDQYNWSNWPPYIYVEDVATLGTPHTGTWQASVCGWFPDTLQCDQMASGSSFLNTLPQNPQSSSWTDWTLVASESDERVSTSSALGMRAGHYVAFNYIDNITHMQLIYIRPSGTDFTCNYWNYYDPDNWHYHPTCSSP